MAMLDSMFKRVNVRTARSFEALVRLLLSLLLLALLGAMGRAVYAVGARFFSSGASPHELLITNLLDALTVLALLEVYKTTQTYFTVGRVKVTYILDTVLVVLLTEMMAFWFRDLSLEKVLLSLPLIVTLFAARVLAIRFSPDATASAERIT